MPLSSMHAQPSPDRQFEVSGAPDSVQTYLELWLTLKLYLLLLMVVPLVAATLALGAGYALNRYYVSAAYLGPLDEKSSRLASSVIYSAKILDTVLQAVPDYLPDESDPASRRRRLSSKIHWVPAKGSDGRQPGLYVLEVQDRSPTRAQAIAKVIVDNWLLASGPPPDERGRLERALESSKTLAGELSVLTTELLRRPGEFLSETKSSSAVNYADLFRLQSDTLAKIEDLKNRLAGMSRDIVFTQPMPASAVQWSKASVFGATAILSFVALFGFLHWRRVAAGRRRQMASPS